MTDTPRNGEHDEEAKNAGRVSGLDSSNVTRHLIRGTMIRAIGYGAGLTLALISASLLTRHLGVVQFGQYVTVASLVAILAILADAGLTTVGVREYAVRDVQGRHRLMRNLLALRLVVAIVGAIALLVFAVGADYENVMIVGTVLGGAGLIFAIAQRTYVIPLTAELRLTLATLIDLARQALTLLGVVALVLTGSGLLFFFVIPIPVGLTILAVTMFALREGIALRPRFERVEWRYLLQETLPAAAASTLASLFYRVAIVMMSIIATGEQVGYFGASFRVVEAFIAVPSILVGSAYPVLARAADADWPRLSRGFERLFDVCVIPGAWSALVVASGARPVIDVVAGASFRPAVGVLQIQGLALATTFLVALFSGTLWVVRAKRDLVIANLGGVLCAIVLTAVLVPLADARGAAIAMVGAEALLATWLGLALLLPRRELRPSLRVIPKVLVALAAGSAVAFAPIPDVAAVAAGSIVYFGLLLLSRAIPYQIWGAVGRDDGDRDEPVSSGSV